MSSATPPNRTESNDQETPRERALSIAPSDAKGPDSSEKEEPRTPPHIIRLQRPTRQTNECVPFECCCIVLGFFCPSSLGYPSGANAFSSRTSALSTRSLLRFFITFLTLIAIGFILSISVTFIEISSSFEDAGADSGSGISSGGGSFGGSSKNGRYRSGGGRRGSSLSSFFPFRRGGGHQSSSKKNVLPSSPLLSKLADSEGRGDHNERGWRTRLANVVGENHHSDNEGLLNVAFTTATEGASESSETATTTKKEDSEIPLTSASQIPSGVQHSNRAIINGSRGQYVIAPSPLNESKNNVHKTSESGLGLEQQEWRRQQDTLRQSSQPVGTAVEHVHHRSNVSRGGGGQRRTSSLVGDSSAVAASYHYPSIMPRPYYSWPRDARQVFTESKSSSSSSSSHHRGRHHLSESHQSNALPFLASLTPDQRAHAIRVRGTTSKWLRSEGPQRASSSAMSSSLGHHDCLYHRRQISIRFGVVVLSLVQIKHVVESRLLPLLNTSLLDAEHVDIFIRKSQVSHAVASYIMSSLRRFHPHADAIRVVELRHRMPSSDTQVVGGEDLDKEWMRLKSMQYWLHELRREELGTVYGGDSSRGSGSKNASERDFAMAGLTLTPRPSSQWYSLMDEDSYVFVESAKAFLQDIERVELNLTKTLGFPDDCDNDERAFKRLRRRNVSASEGKDEGGEGALRDRNRDTDRTSIDTTVMGVVGQDDDSIGHLPFVHHVPECEDRSRPILAGEAWASDKDGSLFINSRPVLFFNQRALQTAINDTIVERYRVCAFHNQRKEKGLGSGAMALPLCIARYSHAVIHGRANVCSEPFGACVQRGDHLKSPFPVASYRNVASSPTLQFDGLRALHKARLLYEARKTKGELIHWEDIRLHFPARNGANAGTHG